MSDPAEVPAAPVENGEANIPAADAQPTNETAIATDAAPAPSEAAATGAAPAAPPNPQLEKYNEYWNIVKENPSDFQTWTLLISTAEKLEDIEKCRAVFDSFLSEYPLCYGYWKKYADAEVKHGNAELAGHVYERGVSSIPYSVDLWGHFVTFKQSTGATPDDVRGIFERGLAYVATDYSAHTLWDKYIQFETAQGTLATVGDIYTRILRCPLKELERYQNSVKEWVGSHQGSDIMGPAEYEAYSSDLLAQKQAAREAAQQAAAAAPKAESGLEPSGGGAEAEAGKEAAAAASGDVEMADAAAGGQAEGGEAGVKAEGEAGGDGEASAAEPEANGHDTEAPGAAAGGAEVKAEGGEGEGAGVKQEEAMAVDEGPVTVSDEEIKQAWLQVRLELAATTKEEVARRKPFEDAIKRPYFHVKALDAAQLAAWARYLAFIETHGDEAAIITLYERCLVACASYPEFWQRYIRLMEGINMEHATGALQRAVVIYCKRRPEMHLFAAHFEERHGNVDNARSNYKHLLSELAPRLLSAVTAAAHFEARQGAREAACAYFEDLIREEAAKEGSKIHDHLCIHYARFLHQRYADGAAGRAVLEAALAHSPGCRALWEAAVYFEECVRAPDMVERVQALYNRACETPAEGAKGLAAKDREELSELSVDFADQWGDPAALLAAEKAHSARFALPSALTNVKKRAAEVAAAAAAKQARTDAGAAAAAAAAAPAAAAAAAGGLPGPPAAHAGAATAAAAGYYGAAPAAAAGYNYAAYYGQYPGYGYGYGY